MWDWYDRPRPRKPAHGIRAKSQRGRFGQTWWAQKWIAVLESFGGEWQSRLQRGRGYARGGQVVSIEVEKGRVRAAVQGSQRLPYAITIELRALTDAQWSKAIEAMSGQAIFAAKLLAGEMPPNIDDAFQAAQVPLFPRGARDIEAYCSCPDYANPCKHIAAVYYLLGEQFDDDPFLLFRLRGRTKEEVMAALRARRARAARQAAQDEDAPAEPADRAPALADSIPGFYATAEELKYIVPTIAEPEIEAPLLRRLGKPPVLREAELRELYAAMTRSVLDKVLGELPDTPALPSPRQPARSRFTS